MYGTRLVRNRWEYINAGLYVFAAILLTGGFASQLSSDARSGLVVLIGLAIVAAVNAHDLVAHLAGIDYLFSILLLDSQLALVEVGAPLLQMLGSAVAFVGILLLFIQASRKISVRISCSIRPPQIFDLVHAPAPSQRERGYSERLEKQAVNTLVAGPALWLLGSIHNLCQVYERADGHVQVLQKFVQIPFLMGSLLFLVGGIFNSRDITVPPISTAKLFPIPIRPFRSPVLHVGGRR